MKCDQSARFVDDFWSNWESIMPPTMKTPRTRCFIHACPHRSSTHQELTIHNSRRHPRIDENGLNFSPWSGNMQHVQRYIKLKTYIYTHIYDVIYNRYVLVQMYVCIYYIYTLYIYTLYTYIIIYIYTYISISISI